MTKFSASLSSASFDLSWSIEVVGRAHEDQPPVARLQYRVDAREELYVSDRLWDFDRAATRVADPFGVYRFVHEDSLRLVFDQAPWPSNMELRTIYTPLFSRVRAGEARHREIDLAMPIDEYSSLARRIDAPTSLEHVTRVLLVLGYRTRATMAADPRGPAREDPDEVGYVVHGPSLVQSSLAVDPLPVRRRTGYTARYALPGEPPPGPAPST